ncbi:MAG: cytochrome P450 [Turneriella sp.]|nr:cytochrome P450 [Turneriella sp.]
MAAKTIPGPPGLPFLGNIFNADHNFPEFLRQVARYGDVAQFSVLGRRVILISHPDWIQQILIRDNELFEKDSGSKMLARYILGKGLLTSEGEEHRRMRRNTAPAFNRQRILNYGRIMVELAEKAAQRFQAGSTIDMHREMMALTSAIVARALFSLDVESKVTAVAEALEKVLQITDVMRLPFPDIMMHLPLPVVRDIQSGVATLDNIVYEAIDGHLHDQTDRGDLLSMMIAARRESGEDPKQARKALRDEVLTLFLAGHETTANALTWTFYLLSAHPEKYDRLLEEVDSVLRERSATVEDLPSLPYTRQVVAESMRLYPPAWVIGRTALTDYTIGGFAIPKGSELWLSQYVVHRDPRWYIEPERFLPERWDEVEVAKRPRFSYFPFSAGVRNCIGEQFAWQEAVLLLATFSRHWRMRLAPGQRVEMLPQITLRPKHGMRMQLVPRRGQ